METGSSPSGRKTSLIPRRWEEHSLGGSDPPSRPPAWEGGPVRGQVGGHAAGAQGPFPLPPLTYTARWGPCPTQTRAQRLPTPPQGLKPLCTGPTRLGRPGVGQGRTEGRGRRGGGPPAAPACRSEGRAHSRPRLTRRCPCGHPPHRIWAGAVPWGLCPGCVCPAGSSGRRPGRDSGSSHQPPARLARHLAAGRGHPRAKARWAAARCRLSVQRCSPRAGPPPPRLGRS